MKEAGDQVQNAAWAAKEDEQMVRNCMLAQLVGEGTQLILLSISVSVCETDSHQSGLNKIFSTVSLYRTFSSCLL